MALSLTIVVLPMPASPLTSTTDGSPLRASAMARSNVASSARRPTKSDAGRRSWTMPQVSRAAAPVLTRTGGRSRLTDLRGCGRCGPPPLRSIVASMNLIDTIAHRTARTIAGRSSRHLRLGLALLAAALLGATACGVRLTDRSRFHPDRDSIDHVDHHFARHVDHVARRVDHDRCHRRTADRDDRPTGRRRGRASARPLRRPGRHDGGADRRVRWRHHRLGQGRAGHHPARPSVLVRPARHRNERPGHLDRDLHHPGDRPARIC